MAIIKGEEFDKLPFAQTVYDFLKQNNYIYKDIKVLEVIRVYNTIKPRNNRSISLRCKCPKCGNENWILKYQQFRERIQRTCCYDKQWDHIIGQKFNRLTVLSVYRKRFGPDRVRIMVECKCDCGKISHHQVDNVVTGHSKSCGCHYDEVCKSHNLTNMPLYKIWVALSQ